MLFRSEQQARSAAGELREQLKQHEDYDALIARIRGIVGDNLPPQAVVLVTSKGDDQLVSLGRQRGWHFPQDKGGVFAGRHPADSAEAIAHLEALRNQGAQHLLFPSTSFWWLDCYPQFKTHLETRHRLIVNRPDTCLIYALLEPAPKEPNHRAREVSWPP